MTKFYFTLLAALSFTALPIAIYLFALNAIADNVPAAFAYLCISLAASMSAGISLGNLTEQK